MKSKPLNKYYIMLKQVMTLSLLLFFVLTVPTVSQAAGISGHTTCWAYGSNGDNWYVSTFWNDLGMAANINNLRCACTVYNCEATMTCYEVNDHGQVIRDAYDVPTTGPMTCSAASTLVAPAP